MYRTFVLEDRKFMSKKKTQWTEGRRESVNWISRAGGQHIKSFGSKYRLVPDFNSRKYWSIQLPKPPWLSICITLRNWSESERTEKMLTNPSSVPTAMRVLSWSADRHQAGPEVTLYVFCTSAASRSTWRSLPNAFYEIKKTFSYLGISAKWAGPLTIF
jgi:hypothetical protein